MPRILINPNHTKLEISNPRHTTYHAHIQLQVTRHVHISNPDTPHTMHTSHCRSHATSTFPTPTHHIPCTHPTAGHTPRPHFQPRHTTYHAHIQLQVGWLKSLNVPQRADIGHSQQCTSDIQIWMMNIQIYKYTIHPVSSLRVTESLLPSRGHPEAEYGRKGHQVACVSSAALPGSSSC